VADPDEGDGRKPDQGPPREPPPEEPASGEPASDEPALEGFWPKVRATLGRVTFLEHAVAAYYAAVDPATPTRVKAILIAALVYFIVPVDVIPDLILGLGYADDATVLFAAMRMLKPHITPAHRARARRALAGLR
jgi:uncharacterized membrane protein YkvA (DUF1232 family)